MANPPVETVNTTSDKLMLALGVVLVLVGVAAFYLLSGQNLAIRTIVLLVLIAGGAVAASFSGLGKTFVGFSKDAYREVRKVVWPSRKEAGQTTLIVFGFVVVMAIYLWCTDKTIEWLIFSVILGWR
ncbi:preprotein translocase subunit SecE [Robbsia andropogonis]|uniref:Protein translocase subunit SecE n=1 Tax=Robbsia andropogonis TaxID=28092 RepID=A0A0F5JUJ8_9BURK|nr:preprotein translocase subunit SecE [Robbsia andropogonis]KKB61340.1 preprotein translocase subunit SecE [Robbsia andropogonis]MCP1121322.1 preprotein translocase subunit SecE [Robbsia andropogonis]MCP1131140.1 preprotein translocase subunit SecE [Robbsia andropogonis]